MVATLPLFGRLSTSVWYGQYRTLVRLLPHFGTDGTKAWYDEYQNTVQILVLLLILTEWNCGFQDTLENLFQRHHHEVALLHQRVRDFQFGCVDNEVVVEQDIDVDGTVVVKWILNCEF